MPLFKENKELGIKVYHFAKAVDPFGDYTYYYKVSGVGFDIYIDVNPTMNCQVQSIGMFNNFILRDKVIDILKWLRLENIISKAQILIDVNSAIVYTYVAKIKEIFSPEDIVFEQQYTSTNDSIMTMMLLKTNWLLD